MVIPDWAASKAPKIDLAQPQREHSVEPLARPLDRLAAVIVDVFVLLVPLYILLSAPFKRWLTASFILGSEPDFIGMIVAMVALGIVLVVLYQSLLHYFFAATVGKMLFDLRVKPVFSDDRISFARSLSRSLIWLAEFLCLGLPMLSVFSNSRRRSLHDRICDTVVVSRTDSFVRAPGQWERGLVRGFFGACALFALMVGSFEVRTLLDRFKSEKRLSVLMEHESSQCDVVNRNLDEDQDGEHARLTLAMSLYAAGLADRSCLEAELEREMATQTPVGPITYLAQAFVNSDDAEVSNSYLDQVCEDAPDAVECAMSKVVSKWSEEDWASVEELLNAAPKGSGYLEVWAVRHFMKQADYKSALGFLDTLSDHHELAEFSQAQRVRALYNSYAESEANVALAQALPTLSREEGEELSEWMCSQQLQSGCAALEKMACRGVQVSKEIGEIDFEHTGQALSRVLALECKGDNTVDYLTFSESVKDEDWQMFFRANLKQQKNDLPAAFKLYAEVINSSSAPDLLRVEALRRVAQFAQNKQIGAVVEMWGGLDSREAWVKAGNLLFTRFAADKNQEWALRVARHLMNSEALSPQSVASLTDIVQAASGDRKPASVRVKKDVIELLDTLDDDEGEGDQ